MLAIVKATLYFLRYLNKHMLIIDYADNLKYTIHFRKLLC